MKNVKDSFRKTYAGRLPLPFGEESADPRVGVRVIAPSPSRERAGVREIMPVAIAVLVLLSATPCLARIVLDPQEKIQQELEKAKQEMERKRQAPPVLAVSLASFSAKVKYGEAAQRQLQIRNAGGSILKWTANSSVPWATVEPARGELGYQAKQSVAITLSASGLEAGRHPGTVTIAAGQAAGSPKVIALELTALPRPVEAKPEPLPPKPLNETEPPKRLAPPPVRIDAPPVKDRDERNIPWADRIDGLGLRAGLLMPGSGDTLDYGTGMSIGLFWRPARPESALGYELEVRFADVESETGSEASTIYGGHAYVLWQAYQDGTVFLYALGGLSTFSEQVDNDRFGSGSAFGIAVDLGAGVTFRQRFDAQLSYSLLLQSNNVGDVFMASLGVMF